MVGKSIDEKESLKGKIKKCPKCGWLRNPSADYCSICGTKLVFAEIKTCTCGEEYVDGGNFCEKCGRKK